MRHSAYYRLYLKSKAWQNIRNIMIAKYKLCQVCGGTDVLQCHHLTYERLGRERLSDLKLLCKECHKEVNDGR